MSSKKNFARFLITDPVQEHHFKQLLQDIEDSETTYQKFVLSQLPQHHLQFYGSAGSKVRREIQQTLSRLKKRAPKKYLIILAQAGVTPSQKTIELGEEYPLKMSNESDEDKSIAFSLNEFEDKITSDYEDDEESESGKLVKKVEKLSITKPSPARSRYTTTPTRKKKYPVPPTPPRSLPGLTDYISTSSQQHFANLDDFYTTYGIVDVEHLIIQWGTKTNPYITFVDTKFPERNGGMFGFQVNFVSAIQHENFRREGYKIRVNVSPLDYEEFEMTIPSEHEFPQFTGRCTLLKGPSRVFWHRENDIFEETADDNIDDATKSAFSRDTLQVKKDETRHNSYLLFVFPVGTFLDNNIFSGASSRVQVNQIPLKLTAGSNYNKFKTQMNNFELIWTIGVKGGEELADIVTKVDYSKLF